MRPIELLRAIVFVLMTILFCCPTFGQQSLQERITKHANAYVDGGVINSAAIGVIDGDNELIFGVGQLSRKDDRVPDGDTVYEIGSISKVFTGILLADAINRDLVKADQPVQELLPEGISMPVYAKKPDR